MASKVSIANLALSLLGDVRIISLSDAHETAKKVNAVFDLKVEELISMYPWNFAKKRLELAKLEDGPLFGWLNAFALPSDLLRLLEINGQLIDRIPHAVEDRKLLLNDDAVKVLYIRRVTNSEDYPAYFNMAFSAYLAAELAYPITQSNSMQENMMRVFQLKLATAKSIDAQSGGEYRRIRQSDILLVRGRRDLDDLSTGYH